MEGGLTRNEETLLARRQGGSRPGLSAVLPGDDERGDDRGRRGDHRSQGPDLPQPDRLRPDALLRDLRPRAVRGGARERLSAAPPASCRGGSPATAARTEP